MCTLTLTCAHLNRPLHLLLFSALCLLVSVHLQQLSLPRLATALRNLSMDFCGLKELNFREEMICRYHGKLFYSRLPNFISALSVYMRMSESARACFKELRDGLSLFMKNENRKGEKTRDRLQERWGRTCSCKPC